jgi:hypothetical protein
MMFELTCSVSRPYCVQCLLGSWLTEPLDFEPDSSMIFLIVGAQPPHFAAQPSDA